MSHLKDSAHAARGYLVRGPRVRFQTTVAHSAVTLLVMAVLVGCGSSTGPSEDGSSAVQLQLPPNATQAFDMVDFADYDAVDEAVYAYQQKCVAAQGLQAPAKPEYDIGSQLHVSLDSFGPTTDQEARLVGLKTGPVVTTPGTSPKGDTAVAMSDCATEAEAKLDDDVTTVRAAFLQLVNDLGNEYNAKFQAQQEQLLVDERQCAVDDGWRPTSADDVKKVAEIGPAQLFGVLTATPTVNDATGVETYIPLPREIDLALELEHCRVRLGLPARGLAEAKAVQAKIVSRLEARISQQNSDMAKASRAAIKELT